MMSHATFVPHVGDPFVLALPDGASVELRLVDADLKADTDEQHSFALEFKGPLDPRLNQGVFPLEHAALGMVELFLVPVDIADDGRFYEAFFNLIPEQDA